MEAEQEPGLPLLRPEGPVLPQVQILWMLYL
jgi:hypothetical protein